MATRLNIFLALSCWLGVASATPIVVDADGRMVGFYQGAEATSKATREFAVSEKGYRFAFQRKTGRLLAPQASAFHGGVVFTSGDCTGPAYLNGDSAIGGTIILGAEPTPSIITQPDPPLYYVPQVPVVQIGGIISSAWQFSATEPYDITCVSFMASPRFFLTPIQPNDPNETGIPNNRFRPPLRVISSWLLRDGFERPLSGSSPTGDVWARST
jgi:hypothetical protein